MRSTLDSTIPHHINSVAGIAYELGELIEWCTRAVELTAAVIGKNDAGGVIARTPASLRFKLLILTREMVPRGGIEPPTLRFSVACSTN
jgi:hypothetical protein